jgi:hypothetical protein
MVAEESKEVSGCKINEWNDFGCDAITLAVTQRDRSLSA